MKILQYDYVYIALKIDSEIVADKNSPKIAFKHKINFYI